MKTEYFSTLSIMLRSQLLEEQESYKKSLKEKKEFEHLKKIKQRIKSINNSLQLMEGACK
jgi:hypothetical protein